MSNFHVGQKVVCVKPKPDGATRRATAIYEARGGVWPTEGAIYTVTGLWAHPESNRLGLFLAELENPKMDTLIGWFSPPFDSASFRPAVERKTDISIFAAMLNTQRRRVSA